MLTALNKIDRLDEMARLRLAEKTLLNSVVVSATTGEGIPDLLIKISAELFDTYNFISVHLPYKEGDV